MSSRLLKKINFHRVFLQKNIYLHRLLSKKEVGTGAFSTGQSSQKDERSVSKSSKANIDHATCYNCGFLAPQFRCRRFSTEPPKSQLGVKTTSISKLLTLREVTGKENSKGSDKRLVILFSWLYAKPAALAKYCDLYHERGLDILTVKGRLVHFLWPPKALDLLNEIMECLNKECGGRDQYLVHSMSIGAYLYTICMRENESFRKKVIGQIFDSIVLGSYDNMSTGIGEAIPGGSAMKRPLLALMNLYYHLTRKTTKDEYDRLVSFFKENPILVPTLILYAENDPMCDRVAMETMIKKWKEVHPQFDFEVKSWKKSAHAVHLKFHEEEYVQVLNKLLNKLDL